MASRRTISYIGLWALIMPWLGFSWETKTLLFSLTGVLLLVIGNRHYHSEKKKNQNQSIELDKSPIASPENKIEKEPVSMPVHNTVPEYMQTSYLVETNTDTPEVKEEKINSENPVFISVGESKPKPRPRKRIEMAPRVRRTDSKPISLDSLETDYEQNQI